MSKKSIGIIKDHTPNFSFKIPNFNIATWHDFMESNFRSIDALFYNLFGINNFKGEWTKITSYKAGEVIFIGEDKDINGNTTEYSGRLVKVLKDHTTDNSDYFNIFYVLHPDYYELFFDANNAEYFSEKAFEYKNEANNYLKASQELNSLYQQYLADTQKAKEAAQKSEQNAKTSEQNAQNASTTAVNTVKTATDLLNSTQAFTENAIEEINNTKNETISTITNIKDEVSQQIDEKITTSEQIIDEKIETAQNELDTTITNAIIAAKDEVKQEADIAIENASTIAADYAKNKLDTYVDEVVEPPLQNYVDSAENFKNEAENAKNLAKTEATNSANSAKLANISEQNAKTYENSANNYKNDAQTYADTSKNWADKAEQAAEDCQNIKNSLGVVYEFKGSVQTFNDLPINAEIGNVYNIIETGVNYAKIEDGWDNLGMDIDLSIYATKEDVNKKQNTLVSGTNIKTINNNSLLGSGNILIKTAPDIDNKTITQNTSSQLQAIGVINQNSSGALKLWTGTKAQYDNITKDANTLYNVTDDESSAIKILNELIEQIQNQVTNTLNKIYPIGSIYLTINSENPATLLGFGTWTQVSSGKVLQGSDSSHTAGSTIEAGLPNISGSVSNIWWKSDVKTDTTVSGAITTTGNTNSYVGNSSGSGYAVSSLSFSASRSNSIYGNSSTVQPPAFVVNIWQRTA